MRHKILTVDDSQTIRIFLREAFKPFDCEIFEAANGLEGLSVAAKAAPDLILLDVTMLVMNGVEMLTRLKANPLLKAIPVIMLTAEGGREHVLNMITLGARDYVVKPFKKDTLIEKVGRIISLKPLTRGPGELRSILDTVDILVVEDKPAIIQQIEEGLKHTPWRIHGVSSQNDAVDFCGRLAPDVIIVSLSLPEGTAFTLLRTIRASLRTKFTPVVALVVKTDVAAQSQAEQVGFSSIITKPLLFPDFETKIAKSMNLDTSRRYFNVEGDCLIMSLPENCTAAVLTEVTQYLQTKLTEAVDSGQGKVLIDIHNVRSLHMGIVELLMKMVQMCRDLAMQHALIGNPALIAECKGVAETNEWTLHETIEDAKAYLEKSALTA